MNNIQTPLNKLFPHRRIRLITLSVILLISLVTAGVVLADVYAGRKPPSGAVPNPGTQQQELANITFPAPYNVFEFVVTCAGCHGGSIDQQAGHFGNWAGSSMASAARDPIFRANQIITNNTVRDLTGLDGAGNMCMRCHSPNGWYSGRFDPTLAGDPEGTTMIHSILASTDDEGILCEFCHRSVGNVTMRDPELLAVDPTLAGDSVWNMLAGVSDWPHLGRAYTDQAGDPTIADGNPYGDTTLKINDGMTYVGKYTGSVDVYTSDQPIPGTPYTGQTYAVYPPGWTGPKNPVPAGEPQFNAAGEEIVYNVDGSVSIHFEAPIGPPLDPATGTYDYNAQALSLEHPTVGDRDGLLPQPVPQDNKFLRSSEFCGSCHDLTVPVLNHGMPEQRTYTEWKYSAYNTNNVRCQDCHMPTMKHEYADDAPVSVNPDPLLSGWFPYAKDRNAQGGTAFHKFAGANRDLPQMMTELYPEVDLEVIGAPTGNDPRVFPGMLSNRDPMWERTQRNTEVSLLDAVDVEVLGAPTYDATTGKWSVQVQVTNNTGHRIPSGYPDGRRLWLGLSVSDATGAVVYQSGYYDAAAAELLTAPGVPFNRALSPIIDDASNAVMVYERVTGTCVDSTGAAIFPDPTAGIPAACTPSPALTNNFILFDNRISPAGFDYTQYRISGVKFWNYDPATFVPYEEAARYPNGQSWDVVTYSFAAPADALLDVRAEAYWETHTREFMEYLRTSDKSTVRPEGPPSIYEPNYPLTPNYLSDQLPDFANMTALDGTALKDNWGGIAYASWLLTGKGAPYLVASDDTASLAAPDAPANLLVAGFGDPFTVLVTWDPVASADGYLVWIRYGLDNTGATASWDKLGIVYDDGDPATPLQLVNTALNVSKTYGFKVQAFNGAGYSADSAVFDFMTPTDLPLPPEALRFVSSTTSSISLSWFDIADNETDFIIQRQDVPVVGPFITIATIPSQTPLGLSGGNSWTDTAVMASTCYNYQVAASNAVGQSTFSLPVQACTQGAPTAPSGLTATAVNGTQIDLAWTPGTGEITGYRIERSTDGGTTWPVVFNLVDPAAVGYSDLTVQPGLTYWYQVSAYNPAGSSPASNIASATTPAAPAAPSNLTAVALTSTSVQLNWTDNALNEDGFTVERAVDDGVNPPTFALIATIPTPNTTSYLDTTAQTKTTYVYRVAAYNAQGSSAYSNTATVVTPGEIPQAPSNLRISQVKGTSLNLSWRDNATNEQGFYVERSLDGVNFSRIATLGINASSYTDTGLTTSTTYWYRVQAYNADGLSAYSETVSATTKKK